jgi:hypothetical protein
MKSEINEDSRDIISQIVDDNIYQIDIFGSISIVMLADAPSLDIITKLTKIIQIELEFFTYLRDAKDEFDGLCHTLYHYFRDDFKDNKDLENVIENKIKRLEENTYFVPKKMCEACKDEFENENNENEYEELSLDQVAELFISLREKRIMVYKALLKDFQNNKEAYFDYIKKILIHELE